MVDFYIKDEDGEFRTANAKVEELWREKSDKIVATRLAKIREKETAKIREEITEQVRQESTKQLTEEIRGNLESEWKQKLAKAEAAKNELEVSLRRKTIATEYGFKPEVEKYLGSGNEEEMRKEADTLKANFGNGTVGAPDKETSTGESTVQKKTGVRVVI